jgi:hypothetical protein
MRKAWHIKGHDDDKEEDNDVNNDSVGLETSLGTVKDKQSLVGKQKYFNCRKTGCRSAKCPNKKKKGRLEKAGAVTDASVQIQLQSLRQTRSQGRGLLEETLAQSPI